MEGTKEYGREKSVNKFALILIARIYISCYGNIYCGSVTGKFNLYIF